MHSYKKILLEWMDYVSSDWLNVWESPVLRPTTEKRILKMKGLCCETGRIDEVWAYIEDLEKLDGLFSDEFNLYPRERQQMFVECALAAFKAGNAKEALRLLGGAVAHAKYDVHSKAVIHWMTGIIHWSTGAKVDALAEWEEALNEFRDQIAKMHRVAGRSGWYKQRVKEMEDAIKYAAEKDVPPPIKPDTAAEPNEIKMHLLKSLPVIGEIPAGFPLKLLPAPVGDMTSKVVILSDNRPYRIISLLRERHEIHTPQTTEHFILKVIGNSMNQSKPEPIEDGDYVLLRRQSTANSGDIVAADIVSGDNRDDRVTLKRFKIERGRLVLVPESSDPEYQAQMDVQSMFTEFDEGFHVRGVAIAVFKVM